ncbi:LuxR C-terminal-related transcriptional regulator [Vagococcus entomophilus]|uniref:HTH luxR-type domain-containing protein n=1 Tax=Vagococcus entomophilus TaxID=1160095 RepID=A0A430AHZ3_9ENTE|nr:LuxR C-terminal-related transcriptional regulator [Vagococcus entomophilus]RSU07700.1 hypothetical protein CBF30_00215 [Vagococcus entomophilus]
MEVFVFIYNIGLLLLLCVTVTICGVCFLKTQKKIFLLLLNLFLFFILDNIVIYMTEFIHWFASSYNQNFMTAPTFKTLISVATVYLYYAILAEFLHTPLSKQIYFVLTLLTLYLLCIPVLSFGALKVWLYYFPMQLFLFVLSLLGLKNLKQKKSEFSSAQMKRCKRILLISLLFSIFITIEDSIVIFNIDVYSNLLVRIQNRNFSEDFLSIFYAGYSLIYCGQYCLNFPTNNQAKAIAKVEPNTGDIEKEFIHSFCKHFALTLREQEIFILLVERKSNQEIADALYISIGTVKTHVHNIYQKLSITKRSQLSEVIRNYQTLSSL